MIEKKICIMLSAYNGEKYIEEQIESIEKQEKVFIDLVIRDDGSTDRTVEIIERFNKNYHNIYLIKGTNIGAIKSFCKLAEFCEHREADYYAFSDQDDYWMPDKLYSAVTKLDQGNNNKPLLYFSNLCYTDEYLNPKSNIYTNSFKINKKTALIKNYAYGCTTVFNSKMLYLFNRNNNARMWMHDFWLYLIAVYIGNAIYDSEPHIYYRQHEENSVGYKHSIKKEIAIKKKSFTLLKSHPRENMAIDFKKAYIDYLSKNDLMILDDFISYRKSFSSRIKHAIDKEYRVYDSNSKNFFLFIRFIIGAI